MRHLVVNFIFSETGSRSNVSLLKCMKIYQVLSKVYKNLIVLLKLKQLRITIFKHENSLHHSTVPSNVFLSKSRQR